MYSEDVVTKLFSDIAKKYEDRNGRYTQILKLDSRRGSFPRVGVDIVFQSE
ncbi:MAG: hypothetical protein LBT52_00775 [Clostridiales Family XIII bacterium]|nr:hypothetical protein [Clostridiales Family XIII bacterium]